APQWVQYYTIYTSQASDTWASIAKQFNVNQTLLIQMNGGTATGPVPAQVKIPQPSLNITATQTQLQPYLPSTQMTLPITPEILQLAQTSPVLYTLSKTAAWHAATPPPFAGAPVTNPVGSPGIWFFPTALVDKVESQTQTHPYALSTGTKGDLSSSSAATEVSAYDWATIIPIAVRQVPGTATGSKLPNTYSILGA